MAYKFQLGAATLSGSTKFEDRVELAGGLEFSGSVDTVSVGSDHFMFLDGGATGASKVESIADLMTAVAGDGLGASSGVLKVDLDEFSAATVSVANDSIAIIDADDSNATKKESVADLMSAVAGAGLGASSGVLGVGAETNGGIAVLANGVKMDLADLDTATVDVANDSIAILDAGDSSTKRESVADLMTAVAGSGLGASSGQLSLDIDELDALGGIGLDQTQDHFVFSDNGTEKKITFSNLQDAIFADVSADIVIAAGGAATIQANAVEGSMLNTDVISAQTELAADGLAAADEMMISDGGVLKKIGVDTLFTDGPGLLGAAAVSVSADHMMFLDGGATGDAKTVSFADLATGMAGTALQASSGQLRVKVTGSMSRSLGAIGLSGSIAGAALTFEGDEDSVTKLDVAVNSTSFAISSDEIQLKSTVAGNGLALGSHALSVTIADDGGLDANANSSGKLGLDLNDLAAAVVDVANDSIAIIDANDFNISRKESVADLIAAIAGDGLAASSGVLSLDLDEFSELDAAPHATEDEFMVSDNGTEKRVSMTNVANGAFALVTGDVAIASGGAATIQADAVESGMLNDNVISGQTELAQGGLAAADELLISDGGTIKRYGVDSLAKDSGALTSEAVLAVADDYVLFLDGGASGETKKEQFSDIISNIAGQGLTGNSGVLNVRQDVNLKADGGTLAAGVNYFANASADASVNLPASPTVGDVVIAKAGNLTSGATITIGTQGSHAIDGADSVTIESPFGAVTCVYVVANDWRLI